MLLLLRVCLWEGGGCWPCLLATAHANAGPGCFVQAYHSPTDMAAGHQPIWISYY